MTNIVLCGGRGTRLWPLSRTAMPKQFLPLFEGKSLFQRTLERNRSLCDSFRIVSNTEQYFLARDQVEEMGLESRVRYLLEPLARNTAPAIALAAMEADPEELLLVTPSDHVVSDTRAYADAVKRAAASAEEGYLVTFGIRPEMPETGYGYILAEGERVLSFIEKPSVEKAQEFLAVNERAGTETPRYLWNGGLFCFRASIFLEELQRYAPSIYETALVAWQEAKRDEGTLRISHERMAHIPEESVDIAIMERSDRLRVVPCSIGWNDLGSFDALDRELPRDETGNTLSPSLIAVDAQDNFVHASERTVALLDVDNLIVVDTADALLIARKGSSQRVREVVARLRERETELPHIHVTAHRPWGTYTVLETGDRYKIKRIVVKPGKRLSFQKHFHRSEHWIVVSGTAQVRIGEHEQTLRANESVYIPMGTPHRLENPGRIPLVLVEAQVGDYTGEDDIVRLEDDFERL